MTAEEARKKSKENLEFRKNKFFDFCLEQISQQVVIGKQNVYVDVQNFDFSKIAKSKLESLGYEVIELTEASGVKSLKIKW